MDQNLGSGAKSEGQLAPSIGSLTEEKRSESIQIEIPSIELPTGGGAIRGIDEKFTVNAANGTGQVQLPIPASRRNFR